MTERHVAGRSHREAPTLRYDPSREELAELLDGEPRYRLDQVWDGIHERGEEIDDLTNVPKALRARLAEALPLGLTPEVESISDDGATVKWLWKLHDDHRIETAVLHRLSHLCQPRVIFGLAECRCHDLSPCPDR